MFIYGVAKLGFAAIAAFALGLVAHEDFGLSRGEIGIGALALTALTAAAVIIDAIGVRHRKPQ